MKSDFFYSKSTRLYVSRKPLKIDSRVNKAAQQAKMNLSWDDEGRINFIDFDDSKKILDSLGSLMLSPVEYWKVLEDAKNEADDEMIQELTSSKYCEWLDRVYLIDKTWIDHPKIIIDYEYSGEKKKSVEPVGKPGWFNPEDNINLELGIPKTIKLFREKFETSWKYWSPDFSVTQHRPRAPIRGYVTSVGKPSFDQGMPVDKASQTLSNKKIETVDYKDFVKFIKTSKLRLDQALKQKKDIVFVMGHKNPDTDTVVSSIFESWRNHLLDKGDTEYIPIVQNHKIPDEIQQLLGDEISNEIVLDQEELYIKSKQSGLVRWISVDQNREPEIQRYFISIIDHHVASEISILQDLPKTMEMIGSCAALITQKMLGSGFYPDKSLARILHGATLMDTENRVVYKMTSKDKIIMDYLKDLSEIKDENKFYSDLMSFLLNTDDPDVLFSRDYKEDWGFGFAVAKIKGGFGQTGKEIKKDLITRAVDLAKKNNVEKNLPLTVLRITDYKEDNITVNRERVYLVFNKESSKEFKSTIFELLEKIVKFEFGAVNLKSTLEYIEFWGTGMQLSRKKTAPILEPIVKVFNEYFYSPSNKLWIKRDFLKKSNEVIDAEKELGLKISYDKQIG